LAFGKKIIYVGLEKLIRMLIELKAWNHRNGAQDLETGNSHFG
jgi:hypothetical protein